MRKILFLPTWALLALAALPPAAPADEAQTLLDEIQSLTPPKFDATKHNGPDGGAYDQQWLAEKRKVFEEKADLEKRFYASFPNHPKTAGLLQERWNILCELGRGTELSAEAARIIDSDPHSELAQTARLARVEAALIQSSTKPPDIDRALALIDEALQSKPDDERAANPMLEIAAFWIDDAAKRQSLLERLLKTFPHASTAKKAKGLLRQDQELGKPFELAFTDAISGRRIDLKDLRGKVIVIDFWATWCGPCVAAMPRNNEIYRRYKDKGVEFIGVSLDQSEAQGGLAKLKDFCKKNAIAWPQYHQGDGLRSKFSTSWGIFSVPQLFIVDTNGNLHVTLRSAKDRSQLDKLIPQLLDR